MTGEDKKGNRSYERKVRNDKVLFVDGKSKNRKSKKLLEKERPRKSHNMEIDKSLFKQGAVSELNLIGLFSHKNSVSSTHSSNGKLGKSVKRTKPT